MTSMQTTSNPGDIPGMDDNQSPTETDGKAALLAAKFAHYRPLVPLLARPDVLYLNASYSPPSNLLIHAALSSFAHDGLYDPHPKPAWQAQAEDARALIAQCVNAGDPEDLAFTRDTTEALGNFIRAVRFRDGDNVVLLDSEHPNHAYGWTALQAFGLEVRRVPTMTTTAEVKAADAGTFLPFVDDRTRVIGLSSIMFHSGTRNDIAGICAAFRPRGIHVLADITQQVGFAVTDVRAMGVSAAAFSLHKGLNCPTGLACLYVDPQVMKELDPVPPIMGAGAVKNIRQDLVVTNDPVEFHPTARRFDHLNMSLVGAVAAKAFLQFHLDVLSPADVEEYLYTLGDELREECGKLGIGVVGPTERRGHAPHLYVLDLLDPFWPGFLRGHGVYVSTYRLGVRVSLGFYNNSNDVKRLAEVLRSGLRESTSVRLGGASLHY